MRFHLLFLLALVLSPLSYGFSPRLVEQTNLTGTYTNGKDRFQVLQSSSGKLTLLDLQTRRSFVGGSPSGVWGSFPIVEILKNNPTISYSWGVQSFVHGATVALTQISTSSYKVEIRLDVTLPLKRNGQSFHGTLIFVGTIEGGIYEAWDPDAGIPIKTKMIMAKLDLMGLEDSEHHNADPILFSSLNYVIRALPPEGLESMLTLVQGARK